MKTITAALFLSVLLVSNTGTAQNAAGPRIVVPQDRYDLGNVAQGTVAAHVFEIKNTGTETLVIERVQAG